MSIKRLTRNAAMCNSCGSVIESRHRHDFNSCECGRIFIDGGLDYNRMGFKNDADWTDLCEYVTISDERLAEEEKAEKIWWELYGKKQEQEIMKQVYVQLFSENLK